jgi:hypothetical protein
MLLKIKGDRAILHTRMTPSIVYVVPRLEGRRKWLKGGGLALEPTGHNIDVLLDGVPNLEIQYSYAQDGQGSGQLDPSVGNRTYAPKTTPFLPQKRALKKMNGSFALFMPQGTGKTKVVMDHAGFMWAKDKISGVIVVAPKGVHRQWVEEQLPTHYGSDYDAHFWPLKELPQDLLPGEYLKWITINIDAMKIPRGKAMLNEFIVEHRGRVMMVLDESYLIKNSRSQRWKAADELGRKCLFRLIMTGTPIAKDLQDEWSQLKWLDESILGIRYARSFRNEYCIMGGWDGKIIVGHKNMERFKEKVDPHSFRCTREEAGILPKTYDKWRFDLSPMQRKLMTNMKQTLIAQIDSGEISTAANAAVAVMRLQQIANGFVKDDDGVIVRLFRKAADNPRIIALGDLLDSIDSKVVIWARFHEDIQNILSLLGDRCVTYYGPDSAKKRAKAKEAFIQTDVPYFVATPGTGGVGLDGLQTVCRRAVYYSNSDNSIDRWQSEDRISRVNEIGAATITDLVAISSTDAKILRNLAGKKALSDMALGEIREWLEND